MTARHRLTDRLTRNILTKPACVHKGQGKYHHGDVPDNRTGRHTLGW